MTCNRACPRSFSVFLLLVASIFAIGPGATDVAAATPLFLPAAQYSSGGLISGAIAVADVNGDGKPDLLVANYFNTIGVLLGNGDGTFQPVVLYDSGPGTYAVAVGDINNDGYVDLVVANQTIGATATSGVSVLLGNGDGTFQPPVVHDAGSGKGVAIAVADLNHDGKLDVVAVNWGSIVAVLLGNGDGTLQPVVQYDCGVDCDSITIADVNGDGKPDLLVGTDLTVAVMLGNGDGTFQPKVEYSAWIVGDYPVGIGGITVADVNGDTKADVVAASQGSGNSSPPGSMFPTRGSVAILLGNGDGTFHPAVNYDSGGYTAFSTGVADVNGDGKLDLVVTNFGLTPGPVGSIGVLLGNGDGTFQPAITYYSGGGFAFSLVIADLNADGRPDVVVCNQSNSVLGVLLNGAQSPDTTPPVVTRSATPTRLWPADGRLVTATLAARSPILALA